MEVKSPLLKNWKKKMEEGFYNKPTKKNMVGAGWFDWFCEVEDLLPRMKAFYEIFKDITLSPSINNFRISFKNCCPIEGDLYDYMYLEDTKTDTRIIIEFKENNWTMYLSVKDNDEVSKHFNSKEELIEFFKGISQKELAKIYSTLLENRKKETKKTAENLSEFEVKLNEYMKKMADKNGYEVDTNGLPKIAMSSEDTINLLKYAASLIKE